MGDQSQGVSPESRQPCESAASSTVVISLTMRRRTIVSSGSVGISMATLPGSAAPLPPAPPLAPWALYVGPLGAMGVPSTTAPVPALPPEPPLPLELATTVPECVGKSELGDQWLCLYLKLASRQ